MSTSIPVKKETKAQEWINGLMLGEAEPKDEIMLFPFGEFEHPKYGKLKFDMSFFNEVINNFTADVLGIKPFIDQEHNMGKALAWFEEVPYVRQGVGLFIKPEWTPLGKQLLGDKIYRYFSPWFEDFKNPADGKLYKNVLRGGAATNIPFLKTMPQIVDDVKLSETSVNILLSEIIENRNDVGAQAAANASVAKAVDVKVGAVVDNKATDKILCGGHYMTLEEVQKENEKLLAENKLLKEKAESAEKANAENKFLSEQVKGLSDKVISMQGEAVISKALSEGRILPKDKGYWEEQYKAIPDKVADIISHLPVVVKLSESGSAISEGEENSDPAKRLDEKIRKVSNEKNISYGAAYDIVRKQEPKLAEEVANTEYRSRKGV